MLDKDALLAIIKEKGYSYKIYNHKPLYTVEDSVLHRGEIIGAHSKNLFLKNKKNQFFLFSCLENTKIELKKLSKALELGNISFANEAFLKSFLGVLPGSVTPFGLLNDTENKIKFFLDSGFFKYKQLNFHPLVNNATIALDTNDFMDFFLENNKKVNIFNFNNYTLED